MAFCVVLKDNVLRGKIQRKKHVIRYEAQITVDMNKVLLVNSHHLLRH